MVNAVTTKKELLDIIRYLKVSLKNKQNSKNTLMCEVTVKTGKLCFAVPGINNELPCTTEGVGRFVTPLLYLDNLISTFHEDVISISVLQDKVQINSVTFKANTTFFEDDKILATIKLPLNYTEADILKLASQNYTPEEITFNELDDDIAIAKQKFEKNIEKAYNLLKIYGVTIEDIKALVEKKLMK